MCNHQFVFINPCGAVCQKCELHANLNFENGSITQELARCMCGWSQSGGNGYTELEELGEVI